jgi:hypothetical protein
MYNLLNDDDVNDDDDYNDDDDDYHMNYTSKTETMNFHVIADITKLIWFN